MKKRIAAAAALIICLIMFNSCGDTALTEEYEDVISQFDALQAEYDTVKSQYDDLSDKYNKLDAEYNELLQNTSGWLKLTEEEKAAQLAQAEADRIYAEEAAKKAKEEQAAAEKAAAEKKAAEEKAAREEAQRKAEEEAAAKAAEEKKGYDTGITYSDLARNPDDYKGKKVKFTGEVLQVHELENEIQIRLSTKQEWGYYGDDVVYIYFSNSLISSRILDGDIITIYGTAQGLYTYTTVLGSSITIPLIRVDKIDV